MGQYCTIVPKQFTLFQCKLDAGDCGITTPVLVSSLFMMIQCFIVTDGMLLVQRLSWRSKLDLKDLESVEADPVAMARTAIPPAEFELGCATVSLGM